MNSAILRTILLGQKADLLKAQEKSGSFIERNVDPSRYVQEQEITVIAGVRRSGKSALLEQYFIREHLLEQLLYLNFEDPQLQDFQAKDFLNLYEVWFTLYGEQARRIAFFDEVQNVPGWEPWMNFFSRQKGFKVFVTGSNSTLLSSELSTHLTGRQRTLALYPLSFQEILRSRYPDAHMEAIRKGTITLEERLSLEKSVRQYLTCGGFPRAWLAQETSILREYYENIVSRDIVRRRKIRHTSALDKLGLLLMSNIGRKLNKTKLASLIGFKDGDTVEKYIRYFEECFLGFQVRKFDLSMRVQLRNQPKFYAIDVALATQVGLSSDSTTGYLFENLVLIELLRRGAKVYYWDSETSEMDFVVETQTGERQLIQVCWNLDAQNTEKREKAAFQEFSKKYKNLKTGKKFIIVLEGQERTLAHDIQVIPFSSWALGDTRQS